MNLSLFYSTFILLILLSIAHPTQFDTQHPTSRHLLSHGRGKKSHHSSSSSKSLPSSPPKYARSSDSQALIVFIRPQTSTELGHKARSYTHLLKSKLYTNEEKAQLKRSQQTKKKELKKKSSSPPTTAKTQELVTRNDDDDEVHRCQALLQIDSTPAIIANNEKKTKKSQKEKSVKQVVPPKGKKIQSKVTVVTSNLPKKVKAAEGHNKTNTNEKKTGKANENRPFTPSTNNIPIKSVSSSQSTTQTKSKLIKPETITIIQHTTIPFDAVADEIENKNNSMVGRAFHFMKNIFQLADNILDENPTQAEQIIHIANDQQQQQHHHHSRKLLSIDEHDASTEVEVNLYLTNHLSFRTVEDSSLALTTLSKRQLLSVKTNKHSTPSKTSNTKDSKKQKPLVKIEENKPKVGWTYRYRISRYLEAQNMKRSGNKNKSTTGEGGKSKQNKKKTASSMNSKVSKRKLLEYHDDDDDQSNFNKDQISDEDIIQSVSITEKFHPKRQLLNTKSKVKSKDDSNNVDVDDVEKIKTRRRKKSLEELTDPIVIVQSYDRGLYKPRAGWKFRYRVSRYIDSLREHIREDQERLKTGLQAIKLKTPDQLSSRRKRVSDSDQSKKREERKIPERDDKPQARSEPKKKSTSPSKSRREVEDEPIVGEKDLDPELRKINDEGRRVGWAYRYRIRRKLDYLKQQQKETGIPFDLATLSGKRQKRGAESKVNSTEKKISASPERKSPEKSKVSTSKKPVHDPESAPPTSEERTAGWQHRYRIQRKLDSQKQTATNDNESGKRVKKSPSSKRKGKERIIPKVEESIEQTLNIDDIDERLLLKYLQRGSSYVLSTLCFLPIAQSWSFCDKENDHPISPTAEQSKPSPMKKLKTKKEKRAKQFIRSHPTKLGAEDKATERRIDEAMRKLYKKPSLPPLQTPPTPWTNEKTPKKQRRHLPKPTKNNEEKLPIEKVVVVPSKKDKNKKQFQIIGQEIKIKPKNLSPPSTVRTSPPIVKLPQTTTPSPPLRTISEVIRDEAATILIPIRRSTITAEEIQEEIDETNESIQEQKKLKVTTTTTTTTPLTLIDSTTSGEEDNESTSSSDTDSQIDQAEILDLGKEKNSS